MDKHDLFGLKYFIAFALVIIGLHMYSALIGWKWFNPTSTEKNAPGNTSHGFRRFYHK